MTRSRRDAPAESTGQTRPAMDDPDLFDAAPVGLAVLDPEMRFVRCNQALARINRRPAAEHLGHALAELMPDFAGQVSAGLRDVFRTGEPLTGLKLVDTAPGASASSRAWLANGEPVRDGAGRVTHVIVSVQEITEQERMLAGFRESEAMLKASQQLSLDGFTILRAVRDAAGAVIDFTWEFANPAAERMLGQTGLCGRRLLSVLPVNREHQELFPRYVRLLGQSGADEIELEYDDGIIAGWFRNTAIAIDPDRIAVSFRDITARKQSEQRLQLITREFRHRVKNLLAVIGSLVWHAGKSARDVPALTDTLQRQLQAMAAAQDLIGPAMTGHVELQALADAALKPFQMPALHIVGGPPVQIDSEWSVPLALALHELATNAIKYGPLSTASGRVTLDWTLADGRAALRWREEGGPQVLTPAAPGFGTRLLQIIKRSLPGGEIELAFHPDGLEAELSFECLSTDPRPAGNW